MRRPIALASLFVIVTVAAQMRKLERELLPERAARMPSRIHHANTWTP